MRKRVIGAGAAVLLVSGIALWYGLSGGKEKDKEDTKGSSYEYYYNEDQSPEDKILENPKDATATKAPLIKVDTDPESITVLVNRDYLLPEEYVPADLVVPNVTFSFYGTYEKSYMREIAATALEKLFEKAQVKGYTLKGVSAYRSYQRQKQIYDRNVSTRGKKNANKVSAEPGSSEHQTGLTIDVSCSRIGCALEESFGETEEGIWLAKNCHKYGFIIRYPKGKSDITGYSYEPWHIRYVGKNLAKYLYKKDLTLEEYYQTTTEDNKVDPDKQVKDTDIGAPQAPEMTSAPTPNPSYKPKKTPMPSSTAEPTKTPKGTKKPKKTKKPKVTKTPKPTMESKPTKKPTAEPKPTRKPTVEPKPTPTPEYTKEPDVTDSSEGTTEE